MKPSIGRIVHVCTDANGTVEPAIITRVWSDTCINVTLFPDCADPHSLTSIVQGEGIHEWQWPPRVDE